MRFGLLLGTWCHVPIASKLRSCVLRQLALKLHKFHGATLNVHVNRAECHTMHNGRRNMTKHRRPFEYTFQKTESQIHYEPIGKRSRRLIKLGRYMHEFRRDRQLFLACLLAFSQPIHLSRVSRTIAKGLEVSISASVFSLLTPRQGRCPRISVSEYQRPCKP